MLKVNRSEPPIAGRVGDISEDAIQTLIQLVRRQKWLIATVAGIMVGLAALYCAVVTPKYTTSAQLLIDVDRVRGLDVTSMGPTLVDSGMIDSQVEILKSERIAKAVIQEMKLLETQRAAENEKRANSWLASLLPFMFDPAPPSDYELERSLIENFRRQLTVKRIGLSYVIDLGYKSTDPKEAAIAANQVAEAYIVDQLESKYQATRRASVWMQDRINELRDQALAADRAVQNYKNTHNIVDTGRGLVNDQQLTELNSQLIAARALLAEATARYDRVQSILREGTSAGFSDEVVSDVLKNDVFNRLRTQLLDAQKREADWSKRYGADHVAVLNLRSEIQGLRRAMFNELTRIAETYKSDLDIAKAREDSLAKSFDDLVSQAKLSSNAQVELRELESTAQSYRVLYDNFLQRFMQATQQQSFPITEARLITDASIPIRPSEPKTSLIIFGGLVLGLGAGVGAAYWRESANRSFRSPADVERYLGIDCLGVLPLLKGGGAQQPGQSAFDSSTGPIRHVISDPLSRFAETLRGAKVRADVSIVGTGAKVLGITSTLPKEGKSTIAGNFAQLLAHGGARAILVDADLRNPSLTRQIAPKQTVGLLELLSGEATLEQASIVDPITGVRFLPAVVPGYMVHSNQILASEGMTKLLASLKTQADYIILDLPPMAPVVDVLAGTHLMDGYIYVLEWGASHRDLVVNTLQSCPEVHAKTLGCLLNKTNVAALRHLEGYGMKYYYHKYYAEYGSNT